MWFSMLLVLSQACVTYNGKSSERRVCTLRPCARHSKITTVGGVEYTAKEDAPAHLGDGAVFSRRRWSLFLHVFVFFVFFWSEMEVVRERFSAHSYRWGQG